MCQVAAAAGVEGWGEIHFRLSLQGAEFPVLVMQVLLNVESSLGLGVRL